MSAGIKRAPDLFDPEPASARYPARETLREETSSPFAPVTQDRECWREAIVLLRESGMTDSGARKFFGRLLSQNHLAARDVFGAVQAAKRCGTMDPRSYLTKAIHNRTRPDPSLIADWT